MRERDNYSWIALVLILVGEAFALCAIRLSLYFWGHMTIITGLILIILWILGMSQNQRFSLRSVILTKLLANAIAPRRLGTTYLLLFVIHIGWLTNTAMSLFTPTNRFFDIVPSIIVCLAGLFFLIIFFPNGDRQKAKKPKKVFVSGISAINIKSHNLKPLVSILQLTDKTDTECELFILQSNYYSNEKNQKEVEENYDSYFKEESKRLRKEVNAERNDTIEDKLRLLIKIAAINMFPEKEWISDGLKITFSNESADYNQFDSCFRIVEKFIRERDDDNHVLIFNLTPGTGIVGSLMTLLAIDGDRMLYYYSQDINVPDIDKIKKVEKSQIPLHNLLSQALDTLDVS